MEPVLTQEELEAIYAAMKADDIAPAAIDNIEITGGHSFISNAESQWSDIGKAMNERVGSILTNALGVRTKTDPLDAVALEDSGGQDHSEMMDQQMAVSSGLGEDSSEIIAVEFGDEIALVGMARVLARKYVDRRTGAAQDEDEDEDEDATESPPSLTILEQRLLRDIMRDLAMVAADVLPFECPLFLSSEEPETIWENRSKDQLWMLLRFSVSGHPGPGVWIRGPASLFVPKQTSSRNILASQLTSTRFDLSAELGRFKMSVSELWNLSLGTVIPLDTTVGDPFTVLIGGVPKATGEPLIRRGNIAVKINPEFPKSEDES